MTDFFDLKRPPQVDFDIQFEKDCERMAFNIVFPYRAFYDTDLQKQFCEGIENNVLVRDAKAALGAAAAASGFGSLPASTPWLDSTMIF